MIRTGIPVTQLDREDDAVIATMVELLNAEVDDEEPTGYVDANDPSTIPPEWR